MATGNFANIITKILGGIILMKTYELTLTTDSMTIAMIVQSPAFEAGGAAIRATKIGVLAGFTDAGDYLYKACDPCEVIVGGAPYVLTEYRETLA